MHRSNKGERAHDLEQQCHSCLQSANVLYTAPSMGKKE